MSLCGRFLTAALLTCPLLARTWEIPALAYGPGAWSILRFSNTSESSKSVDTEVYCKDGELLPIGPMFEIDPGRTLDVRIERPSSEVVACWARVTAELEVKAFIEVLKGDELESFERQPAQAYDDAVQMAEAGEVEEKHLYFLNVAENATVLTFCTADRPKQKSCQTDATLILRILVKPRQSITLDVKKIGAKYLMIESSRPGRTITVVFSDEPGRRRFYSAESTISFGRSTK